MVYLVIGWGLPLAITAITIIVNYTTDGLVLYGETSNGSVGPPWINHPASAAVAFLAPIVLALLFNAAAFIASEVLTFKAVLSKKTLAKSEILELLPSDLLSSLGMGQTMAMLGPGSDR